VTVALRVALFVVALLPGQGFAGDDGVVKHLDIRQPRTFGYQLGDTFERRIQFRVHESYVLDTEALPEAGELNTWLAIEAPEIRQKAIGSDIRMQLRLIYQVTNVEPGITQIPVPHHDLVFTDGTEQVKVLVPAIRIDLNTITDPRSADLQDDEPPQLLTQRYDSMALYAGSLLVALAGIAWRYHGMSLSDKKQPFTHAWKRWRHRRGPRNDEAYIAALRDIHQAFNETAGRTVFAETLDVFFDEHTHFAPLRQSVGDYFIHSRAVFFAENDAGSAEQYSRAQLIDFLRACSDAERGLR
jgi:mxaA protein